MMVLALLMSCVFLPAGVENGLARMNLCRIMSQRKKQKREEEMCIKEPESL